MKNFFLLLILGTFLYHSPTLFAAGDHSNRDANNAKAVLEKGAEPNSRNSQGERDFDLGHGMVAEQMETAKIEMKSFLNQKEKKENESPSVLSALSSK